MEEEISRFMLATSKFEFFLVNRDLRFAHTIDVRGLRAISGVNWTEIAARIEERFPFATFNFAPSGFLAFKESSPQYLTVRKDGRLKWDSDDIHIDSWDRLLSRSFAQFRNNIAHGNKGQMPAPFTYGRTQEFLRAGHALIKFVSAEVLNEPDWETPIFN